jgi:succinyl-diaminopimelate desuccinylase
VSTDALAHRTLQLVDVQSVSRDEQELAELVADALSLPLVHRDGCTLLFAAPRSEGRDLVAFAGHLDTVPPQDNLPGRIEDGAVWGLGASDMKAGLAVMMELASWIERDEPELGVDAAFLFFPREELPASESALPAVLETGLLDDASLVVVMEPTDNTLQAGCLGHLTAEIAFAGESAHSARPWQGRNAIEVAVRGLQPVLAEEPREVEVGGLSFVEVLSVTEIQGGIAGNVIPDRVTATLSYRYGPDRQPADAEARLRGLLDGHAEIERLGNSPPARVVTDTPLVRRLREAGGFELEPKQAWTPVAEFTAHGLDAVNCGPGATALAHKPDERVEIAALERSYEALRRFLGA